MFLGDSKLINKKKKSFLHIDNSSKALISFCKKEYVNISKKAENFSFSNTPYWNRPSEMYINENEMYWHKLYAHKIQWRFNYVFIRKIDIRITAILL